MVSVPTDGSEGPKVTVWSHGLETEPDVSIVGPMVWVQVMTP